MNMIARLLVLHILTIQVYVPRYTSRPSRKFVNYSSHQRRFVEETQSLVPGRWSHDDRVDSQHLLYVFLSPPYPHPARLFMRAKGITRIRSLWGSTMMLKVFTISCTSPSILSSPAP